MQFQCHMINFSAVKQLGKCIILDVELFGFRSLYCRSTNVLWTFGHHIIHDSIRSMPIARRLDIMIVTGRSCACSHALT